MSAYHDGKALANNNQWLSDGDTITVVSPAGSETVGEILVIDAGTQLAGVIQAIGHDSGKTVAETGDLVVVRVKGVIATKQRATDASAGDLLSYSGGAWVDNATGAHLVLEAYTQASDGYCVILLNAMPRAAT